MATGETLVIFTPLHNAPPAANYATLDTRNATSPIPILDFDPTTNESAIFCGVMPRNYGGGGITVTIHWMTTATSGNCKWDAEIERSNTDLDSDSFAAPEQTATTGCNGTSGILSTTEIAFTNGAQMDSLTTGEAFRLRITRDAADGADTINSNDVELVAVEIRET